MITIAEKINGSIPSVKKIIETRNAEGLLMLTMTQAHAGADYVDVNVGTGEGNQQDEMEAMSWALTKIQEESDVPISIDSADPSVLRVGLEVRKDRPTLINSTKGTDDFLNVVVPLAKSYDKPLVGLAMDEEGIPKISTKRVDVCRKIHQCCIDHGLKPENIFFDPLVLPISTDISQAKVTLDTIQGIKEAIPTAKTVLAVSNVSYGLPRRKVLNAAFLHMAILSGLDAAILNVLDRDLMGAIKTAEAVVGRDRHCRKYTKFWR